MKCKGLAACVVCGITLAGKYEQVRRARVAGRAAYVGGAWAVLWFAGYRLRHAGRRSLPGPAARRTCPPPSLLQRFRVCKTHRGASQVEHNGIMKRFWCAQSSLACTCGVCYLARWPRHAP